VLLFVPFTLRNIGSPTCAHVIEAAKLSMSSPLKVTSRCVLEVTANTPRARTAAVQPGPISPATLQLTYRVAVI